MILIICIFTCFLININPSCGEEKQIVVKYTGSEQTLQSRFSWAVSESKTREFSNGYWIVYSIERSMNKHSTIGSYSSNLKSNRPSLYELITGISAPTDDYLEFGNSRGDENDKVMKDIGICIHFVREGKNSIDDIVTSNLTLRVDLNDDPLIWIGQANDIESISLLQSLFPTCDDMETCGDLITSVGLHPPSKECLNFLSDIITSSGEPDLRRSAVFWVGQQNTDAALKFLCETIERDQSDDVREHAIFSVSQMTADGATDTLISLARNTKNRHARSKAVFWLGQKASAKAEKFIEDIIYNDNDIEIQRLALLALAHDNNGKSVPLLIKIAHNHPKKKIRKEAIFLLGNSEDPQALEALVEIVKE